jgi:hypothetical protein
VTEYRDDAGDKERERPGIFDEEGDQVTEADDMDPTLREQS